MRIASPLLICVVGLFSLTTLELTAAPLPRLSSIPKIKTFKRRGPIHNLALSPDNKKLCLAGMRQPLVVFDVKTGKPIKLGADPHRGESRDCNFSRDGQWMASSDDDSRTVLWKNGNSLKLYKHITGGSSSVQPLRFSSDSRWLGSGGSGHTFLLWETNSGTLLWRQARGRHSVEGVAFDPKGWFVAISENARGKGPNEPWPDSYIDLLDFKNKKSLLRFKSNERMIKSIDLSENGEILVWHGNRNIFIYEIASRQLIRTIVPFRGSIWDLQIHPAKPWIITAHRDGTISFWNLFTGRLLRRFEQANGPIWRLRISEDNGLLVTSHFDTENREWVASLLNLARIRIWMRKPKIDWKQSWNDLSKDGATGFKALNAIVQQGKSGLPEIEAKLKEICEAKQKIQKDTKQVGAPSLFLKPKTRFKVRILTALEYISGGEALIRKYLENDPQTAVRLRAKAALERR